MCRHSAKAEYRSRSVNHYDVYLVHASEDAAVAGKMEAALRGRGLRVWFNSFRVGPGLRAQMEAGLKDADFGVVVVSPNTFGKYWAKQELDSLFTLETDGELRLLPVWYGVSAAEERSASPMLAARSAAVLETDQSNLAAVIGELVDSVVHHTLDRSPGDRLRSQILTGITWVTGPELFSDSFALYEATFREHFALADLKHIGFYEDPSLEPADDPALKIENPAPPSTPAGLIDVIRSAPMHTGRFITVIGHQIRESVHVLDRRVSGAGLATRFEGWDPNIDLVSHCFQLNSVEFEAGEMFYVHCQGPYHRDHAGWAPTAPTDDALCWVTGLLLASGSAPTINGRIGQAAYLAATTIHFTPPSAS